MARKLGESEGGYRPAAAGGSTDTGREDASQISETPRGTYTGGAARPYVPPKPKPVVPVAPQLSNVATLPPASAFQNEQLRLIQALQQAAQGDPNSRAQQQMRDIYQQQRGQISSVISGARGVAAGAAQEMIQRNQAAADQAYNLDSRMLMGKEQLRAQQALMTELGYTRDQGINEAETEANYQQRLGQMTDSMTAFNTGREFNNAKALMDLAIAQTRARRGLDWQNQAAQDAQNRQYLEGVASLIEAYNKQQSSEAKQPAKAQTGQKLSVLENDK